jgi:hypothetical protein
VSKKLHTLVLPTLNESINITSRDDSTLAQTDVDKLLRPEIRHHLKYARNISFSAPIETKGQFHCLHFEIFNDYERSIEPDGGLSDISNAELPSRVDVLPELIPSIRPLFQGLQDGYLRSFQYVKASRSEPIVISNI